MRIKIALSLPNTKELDRYFSVRLKEYMHNEPAEYPWPDRILVLSDIKGDFGGFCRILLKSGVINKYFEWTFEAGHLVIVGDCFSQGERGTECLWLIYSLEEKAKEKGGYVHFILGNHEIVNMNGEWRYAHPRYAQRKFSKLYYAILYDGNSELWRWLRTKNIIEKVGDILFVHGGISKEVNRIPLSIAEINNLARSYYNASNQLFSDSILRNIFNSKNSPLEYRGYYLGTMSQADVDFTLEKFGVSTIVTGHTAVDRISSYFNGKVLNIDTNHMKEKREGLLIKRSEFYRVVRKGEMERIK